MNMSTLFPPLLYFWLTTLAMLIMPIVGLAEHLQASWRGLAVACGGGILLGLVVVIFETGEHVQTLGESGKYRFSGRHLVLIWISLVVIAVLRGSLQRFVIFGYGSFLLVLTLFFTALKIMNRLDLRWSDMLADPDTAPKS